MARGAGSPDDALAVALAVERGSHLRLEGLCTHLAVADEADDGGFTAGQLTRFEAVRAALAAAGVHPRLLHAANSAGAIPYPPSRLDMAGWGTAVYGHAASATLARRVGLRRAPSLKGRG